MTVLATLASGEMNARAFSEATGVTYGTIKRYLHEGMPCRHQRKQVWIDPKPAREWIASRYPHSLAVNRTSVIYFAQRGDELIKIGWTSDVLRRVKELRKKYRAPVDLLACVPGDKPMELALHKQFEGDHVEDELFRPSDALSAFIASLGKDVA